MNLGRLFLAQKGLCFHCGGPMVMRSVVRRANGTYNDGYTREHIIPVSSGGQDFRNIVLAHYRCNNRRGRRPPTEEMIQRCDEIWDAAQRPTAKAVKTALMRMGWKNQRRALKKEAQLEAAKSRDLSQNSSTA